jgi:Tfp pilus assembly protein PilO
MDKNKKLSKKIFAKAGIAILIITPFFLGVWYVKSVIKTTTAEIVESRKQFVEKSASLEVLAKIQNQYKDFGEAYLSVLHNSIPIKDDLINIAKKLETLATKNNLGFGFSFKGENNPTNEDLGYLMYGLNLEGSDVKQIQDFIKDLNNFTYVNTIESINITRKVEGNSEKIIANLEGKVYFRK